MENRNKGVQIIAVLSLLHAMVDFICIFSLFHFYEGQGSVYLLYNFCAFALQLPIGLIADLFIQKQKNEIKTPLFITAAGCAACAAGAFISPLILGIGNSLFHEGGGILSIHTDRKDHLNGRGLGVFVAPGAFGVTLGMLFAKTAFFYPVILGVSACMCIGIFALLRLCRGTDTKTWMFAPASVKPDLTVSALCLFAVILRSVGGMSLAFSWQKTVPLALALTAAAASGKAAGGFLCAWLGQKKAAVISLCLCALCYLFSAQSVFALSAVFFFNMTMPLTLKMEADNHHDMPGFAFGLLTFGLFLGTLPAYYGILFNVNAVKGGPFISLFMLGILLSALRFRKGKES